MPNEKVLIPIDAAVMQKMFAYAFYAKKHFNSEIAGWGHYSEELGVYKTAPLSKQIVSGAEVDTFPNAILSDKNYDISDMIVQWHSHVDMDVFFSGTDENNIKECMRLYPMLISIIVNCKEQYAAKLSITQVGGATKMYIPRLDYDVELMPYHNNSAISKEVLHKCSLRKIEIVQPKYYGQIYNNYPAWVEKAYGQQDYEGFEFDNYTPPQLQLAQKTEVIPEKTEQIPQYSQDEIKAIIKKANDIVKENGNYSLFESSGITILQNTVTNDYVTIDEAGLELNGADTTWKAFIKKSRLSHKYML